jgi:origin recognition complex subunit 4
MSGCHGVLFQGKQRLLYSLLDAMQSLTSQAVVIGVSCRLV